MVGVTPFTAAEAFFLCRAIFEGLWSTGGLESTSASDKPDKLSSASITSCSCEITWDMVDSVHLRLLELIPDRTVGEVMNRLAGKVKTCAIQSSSEKGRSNF